MLSQYKPKNVIFGPPGTGKTTFLLGILGEAIKEEIPLHEVGFMSFTRSAIGEAKTRAKNLLNHLKEKDFTYFTTLHSFCFRVLNLSKECIINFGGNNRWATIFCKEMGYNINSALNGLDASTVLTKDDRLCLAEQTARNLCITPEEFYADYDDREFTLYELKLFMESYSKFKKVHGLYDFPDMLSRVAEEDVFIPHLQQLFIDETQDLSALQWKVVNKLIANAEQIYIAGDDDQAIYTFAGASPVPIIKLGKNPDWNKVILKISYRVPKKIQEVAFRTLSKIPEDRRIIKEWSARPEQGTVTNIRSIEELREQMREGSWGVLARTNHILRSFTKPLYNMGIRFTYGGEHDSVSKKHLTAIKTYETFRKGELLHRKSLVELIPYIKAFQTILANIQEDFISINLLPTKIFQEIQAMPWYEAFDARGALPMYQAAYYRELLANGENLTGAPRVECLTMHASKGKEWDNVIVIYDVSEATMRSIKKNPDDEYRVLYVAETRAKQNLFRVYPTMQTHYTFEV